MNRVKNILILLTAALTTAGAPIKTGAKAPAVMLRDEANRPWTLAATLAQPATKAVLLYFYPKDDTPGCTKQACLLSCFSPQTQSELGRLNWAGTRDKRAPHGTSAGCTY